ncbi:MAG: hypothetical protein JST63_10210 [Bacteroidetes bacterium]|nr:hypothetical protein [Bacteroidota bacterium]
MTASLPKSKYTENEKLWTVVPGGKMDQLVNNSSPVNKSTYQHLLNRFRQILDHSVADIDYDDTLLSYTDRMKLFTGR